MKMDPLAGLATPAVPTSSKKKKAAPVMQAAKKGGAPKPVPQNFSPIRNARS
jgi:hypothetical protein